MNQIREENGKNFNNKYININLQNLLLKGKANGQ